MFSSSAGGESATFPRMFSSSSADEVFKISFIRSLGQVPGGSGLGVNAEDHGVLANGMADGVEKGEQYNVSLLPLGLSKPKIFCLFRRFRPNWGRFWGEFFPSRGLWSMAGWCR